MHNDGNSADASDMRAVLYAAKSTEDRHGLIGAQLEACRMYAGQQRWTVDSEWSDEAASGYKRSRWFDDARRDGEEAPTPE